MLSVPLVASSLEATGGSHPWTTPYPSLPKSYNVVTFMEDQDDLVNGNPAGRAMKEDRPTIRDVATRAGMSTLTVSRVINDHPSIKQSTRERVERAIRELNYEPNAAAQHVRRGSSRTIGFLMPDFAHGVSALVAQNVERVLSKRGYTVMLACSHFDPATEEAALRVFARNRIEAVLLKTCDESAPEIIARVEAMHCPVVLVDRDLPLDVDAIVSNHAEAMRQAVRYLVTLGHRDIALVAPSPKMRPGRERIRGFKEGLKEAALEANDPRIFDGGQSDESARQVVLDLLRSPNRPTALIAGGNQILYGALEAIKACGLRYPEDISLLGADHPKLASVSSPTITMIDRQPALLAEGAANRLLELLEGQSPQFAQRKELPSIFIEGESCMPRP
ncbi:LacI family DNA-binding transcriptional regulator [Devosia geojensis]|nr:LacI family DNA-binding transcriptional regulator [Devosia geojensis]